MKGNRGWWIDEYTWKKGMDIGDSEGAWILVDERTCVLLKTTITGVMLSMDYVTGMTGPRYSFLQMNFFTATLTVPCYLCNGMSLPWVIECFTAIPNRCWFTIQLTRDRSICIGLIRWLWLQSTIVGSKVGYMRDRIGSKLTQATVKALYFPVISNCRPRLLLFSTIIDCYCNQPWFDRLNEFLH